MSGFESAREHLSSIAGCDPEIRKLTVPSDATVPGIFRNTKYFYCNSKRDEAVIKTSGFVNTSEVSDLGTEKVKTLAAAEYELTEYNAFVYYDRFEDLWCVELYDMEGITKDDLTTAFAYVFLDSHGVTQITITEGFYLR